MDGRDVPPQSGQSFFEALEKELAEIGCGRIATVMGRYYAMDRDNRYERVQRAYAAMVYGEGVQMNSAVAAMERSYADGVTDEFVVPAVITRAGAPIGKISANDSVIFFNFRPDRAREITRAFLQPEFTGFERNNGCFPLHYVSMTQYDKTFGEWLTVAYPRRPLNKHAGRISRSKGKTQLRIAETEKYAHVTFFFNGGVEAPNTGEDRCPHPLPQGSDIRPQARNERLRGGG
jgi:2,3-bisphosphoglycerate-independent phosphoglycerate mutase